MARYQRHDYTKLLNELNRKVGGEHTEISSCSPQKVVGEHGVSAKQKRKCQMRDPRMRYAYSTTQRILHDRDCAYIAEIEDKNFRMKEDFPDDLENWMSCDLC